MSAKPFQIVVAQTAGFCMGVQRAVRMALDASDDPRLPAPIRTHGPLIHNRQVLQVLEQRGLKLMREEPDGERGTVVVRAHGLPRQEQQRLREDWPYMLDATCPHVRRVQRIVRKYAAQDYMCIVVGDRGHAEVEGVLSYADGAGHVVSGPHEVDALPDAERVVVVAQTTQDEDLFRRTVQRVRERYASCRAFETICRSTARRQEEVRALAGRVDAMIVVGGLNSANTRRLAEISAACGTPTYHVETEAQLDLEPLLRCSKVGLTAGASTPNWMIKRVVRRLEDQHRRRSNLAAFLLRSLLRRLVDADVYAAGAAAALTYAGIRLLPLGPVPEGLCMALAFCFVLGQHLLNQFVRRQSLYLSEPCRADFFLAHQGELLVLAAASAGLALAMAFLIGPGVFALTLAGTLAGLMYQVRLPRALGKRLHFGSLEQIPGSKELFVGLACASLAVLAPAIGGRLAASHWHGAAAAFAALFAMACQRTLALDLIGAEGDQLVGREMLAGYMGANRAERLYFLLSAFIAVVMLAAGTLEWLTTVSFALSFCALYGLAAYAVVRRQRIEGEWAEALIDGQLYLAGLIALAWAALFGVA